MQNKRVFLVKCTWPFKNDMEAKQMLCYPKRFSRAMFGGKELKEADWKIINTSFLEMHLIPRGIQLLRITELLLS